MMESVFNLEETERSSLFQHIINSYGFTYVCIWSHFLHPSNCLIYTDGVYKDEDNQAISSSSGSLAMRSFLNYQKSLFLIDRYNNGGVPGFAFIHDLPYMERKGFELLRLASNSAQLQFYQEAGIKTAIFMGCKNGEIELGLANDSSQINFEMELKKLFPGDFRQDVPPQQLGQQARESSSSSSLRSLSMDNSAEYSPFLFNMIQTTSYNMPEVFAHKGALLDPQAPNQLLVTPSSTTRSSQGDPLQQALNQIRAAHQLIPSRELEEAAMTRAIIAAISSSSSPSHSSSSHQPQNHRVGSAFQRYRPYLGPVKHVQSRQNLNRRSLSFFRNLSEARAQQSQMMETTSRPTTNQLHHMISERKRREKINDSFQALRALLPPGSKKDKAAVLSNSREYITSLKSQVDELRERNKILEAAQSGKELAVNQDSGGGLSGERPNVSIRNVGESTSESRVVDLEVNARGNVILVDLMVGVLELVKRVENASVISVDARTLDQQQPSANLLVLRLTIQGEEWDELSLQEAVRRLLDDLAR